MKKTFSLFMLAVLMLSGARSVHAVTSIAAKAWVLVDENDAVLISRNSQVKLPPASTVKLVTAMVVLDRLDPASFVLVSKKARQTRTARPRLKEGEELTVFDLLHLCLMKSNNGAAVALAEAAAGSEDAFVELMNQKARDIGADDTLFVTASGLPKGRQYTTARDLTVILKKALSYPLIRNILAKKVWTIRTAGGREMFLANTDRLLWRRSDIMGKTGFTCNARHCFVGAVDTGRGFLYTAVLGAPNRYWLWRNTALLADMGADLKRDRTLFDYFGPLAGPGFVAPALKQDSPAPRLLPESSGGQKLEWGKIN